jgi:RNA recognition motif-containing protein
MGFGFVKLENAEAANEAVQKLNGKILLDRPIKVYFV